MPLLIATQHRRQHTTARRALRARRLADQPASATPRNHRIRQFDHAPQLHKRDPSCPAAAPCVARCPDARRLRLQSRPALAANDLLLLVARLRRPAFDLSPLTRRVASSLRRALAMRSRFPFLRAAVLLLFDSVSFGGCISLFYNLVIPSFGRVAGALPLFVHSFILPFPSSARRSLSRWSSRRAFNPIQAVLKSSPTPWRTN